MPLQTLPCALDSQTSRQTRQTHEAVSLAVARARRVLVLTGAGISVSSGIPDFRSAHGLYALNKSTGPTASSGPSPASGKDLFDAGLFRDPASAARFYAFIAGLKRRVDDAQPSPTHHFLHTLGAKSKLLRCYTQNIDDLESRLDPPNRPSEPLVSLGPDMFSSQGSQATDENAVPSQTTTASSQGSTDSQPTKYRKKAAVDQPKFVQLHGNLHRVRCRLCSWADDVSVEHLRAFEEGDAPDCPDCSLRCSFQVVV